MTRLTSVLHDRHAGQSLVLVALILALLIPLVLTSIEIANRYLELARMEDALRQAARTAVQTFRYEPFSSDQLTLAAEQHIAAIGQTTLAANLQTVRHLQAGATPDSTAALAQWIILPNGGACWGEPLVGPSVCAELQPRLRGLIAGYGNWQPRLRVAVALDHIAP